MSDTVIKVENLSKRYVLGNIGSGSLSQDLNAAWARLRGKENPNAKIDAKINDVNGWFNEKNKPPKGYGYESLFKEGVAQ